ncbi:Protein of unknown function [Janthinobacterium sp. OK676]|uniref:DUF2867 domain-containing protein n=1 Tax=unclassified Janthinobacterium TaxID=2610881 RepID=UPI00088301F9|nr:MULTISPECIES: DUF2867 domain-containing protein [unclassified Janthinobacterium]PJJ18709.1 uncharacterized protein DUF2867 [Janthinobacterium sp. 67]SDO26639.1 Protein of unknown function [Janthinobacterium sp. OK676]
MQEIGNVVRAVALPPGASIAPLYPGSNLADAYAVALPTAQARQMDMENLARALLGSQPGWARKLMVVRDAIVARFGIRTAKQMEARPGKRIGIFRIFAVSPDEIILGEDDSHLDFRLSVLRSKQDGRHGCVTVASVVHCHNWVGRAYILLIRPFHKLIVRHSLARAARAGFA